MRCCIMCWPSGRYAVIFTPYNAASPISALAPCPACRARQGAWQMHASWGGQRRRRCPRRSNNKTRQTIEQSTTMQQSQLTVGSAERWRILIFGPHCALPHHTVVVVFTTLARRMHRQIVKAVNLLMSLPGSVTRTRSVDVGRCYTVVGSVVCLSVGHTGELCKYSWTNRNAVWEADLRGPNAQKTLC